MRRTVAISVALLLLAGCGGKSGKSTLSGKITYKDQPVNSATLYLFPSGAGEPTVVPVAPDGTFRVADVPAGEYKVAVQGAAGQAGPSLRGLPPDKIEEAKAKMANMQTAATIAFPDKYKKKETSPLTLTVGKGAGEQNLTLTD